jgi:hypothetical protein
MKVAKQYILLSTVLYHKLPKSPLLPVLLAADPHSLCTYHAPHTSLETIKRKISSRLILYPVLDAMLFIFSERSPTDERNVGCTSSAKKQKEKQNRGL